MAKTVSKKTAAAPKAPRKIAAPKAPKTVEAGVNRAQEQAQKLRDRAAALIAKAEAWDLKAENHGKRAAKAANLQHLIKVASEMGLSTRDARKALNAATETDDDI